MDLRLLGDHTEAGRILVQAVHWVVRTVLARLFIVIGDGIGQGPVPDGGCRVHQDTCRLVDDHEVVVFVDDANGYILWRKGILFRKGDTDFIPFLDEVARRRRLSIDGADAVVFDPAPQRR